MYLALPEQDLDQLASQYEYLFTLEDHTLTDGFGMQVASHLKLKNKAIRMHTFGYKEGNILHGDTEGVLARIGLSIDHMTEAVQQIMEEK